MRGSRRRGDGSGGQLLPVQLHGAEEVDRRSGGGGHLCDFSRRRQRDAFLRLARLHEEKGLPPLSIPLH